METNIGTKSEIFAWNEGRRIVDLQELAKQLHCKQCNSLLDLQRTERETRYGLASVLYIHCRCGFLNDVHTSKVQQNGEEPRKAPTMMFEVNIKASINLLMYGGGSPSVLGFLALLDIPMPPPSDASLIVPVTNASHMPSVLPFAVATTMSNAESCASSSNMVSSSERAATSLLSLSNPFVSSAPEMLAPVSSDSRTVAQVLNNYGDSVRDGYHVEYNDTYHGVSDIDEEGGIDSDVDDADEEYIPPSKQKSKVKPKSSLSSKKKAASPKTKKARGKSAAKKTTPQGKAKTVKVNMKNVETERGMKEGEEEVICIKEEEDEDEGRENSEKDVDSTMEWSSAESDHDSEKESGDSQQEEEQISKGAGTAKCKRGRPKGSSTNNAKRARKSEVKTRKDSVPRETAGSADEDREIPSCTLCVKDFNSIRGYNVHMKRVHNQDMKGVPKHGDSAPEVEPAAPEPVAAEIYVCNFCNQPFARDYTVLSHIKHKHWSPTLQPQECYVTMKLGSTILKMPTRKAKVHGFFTCVLCNSTMTREPIAGHICITPEGTLSCVNTCPDGKKLLYLEMNYLFTDKQGYLCDTCGDVFKVPVHLDTHLLKVHGIMTDRHKRCQCHICGTTFSLPSHVKKHIAQKHSVDGKVRTFMCDICGKEYDRLDSMMVHKRRHHTEGKRFQCEHCPKKFFGRSHWLNHTRQHFGASNYICCWCNQQFSSRYSLKVHQRKHTGEKPYQCKLCDACFAQKTSLTVHMKKHQKVDAGAGRTGESSAAKAADDASGRKGAEDPNRLETERPDSAVPTQLERCNRSQLDKSGSGQEGVECGVTLLPDASAVRQERTSLEGRPAGRSMVDPATAMHDRSGGQERPGQGMNFTMTPPLVQRPEPPVDRLPGQGLMDVLPDSPLPRQDTASRAERVAQGMLDLLPTPVPSPSRSDRSSLGVMDVLDASSSARQQHPPPPPPQPAPATDVSQDLPPGMGRRQDFEGSEGFGPPGYKPVDLARLERGSVQREDPWPSQGFVQSDPFDGRRLNAASEDRRLQEDSRSDPRQDPTDTSPLSTLGAGGSQVAFPSFPYPGSSFYY